ncbi:hypothetical protein HDG33_003856 [Paraburkholderia sp. Cpub6]|nr:hypothetical protein [Paraburkholderia sp. Cpub6]
MAYGATCSSNSLQPHFIHVHQVVCSLTLCLPRAVFETVVAQLNAQKDQYSEAIRHQSHRGIARHEPFLRDSGAFGTDEPVVDPLPDRKGTTTRCSHAPVRDGCWVRVQAQVAERTTANNAVHADAIPNVHVALGVSLETLDGRAVMRGRNNVGSEIGARGTKRSAFRAGVCCKLQPLRRSHLRRRDLWRRGYPYGNRV